MIDETGAAVARDEQIETGEVKQRRDLELRILQIRKEAEAARLEALAARLELVLRHHDASSASSSHPNSSKATSRSASATGNDSDCQNLLSESAPVQPRRQSKQAENKSRHDERQLRAEQYSNRNEPNALSLPAADDQPIQRELASQIMRLLETMSREPDSDAPRNTSDSAIHRTANQRAASPKRQSSQHPLLATEVPENSPDAGEPDAKIGLSLETIHQKSRSTRRKPPTSEPNSIQPRERENTKRKPDANRSSRGRGNANKTQRQRVAVGPPNKPTHKRQVARTIGSRGIGEIGIETPSLIQAGKPEAPASGPAASNTRRRHRKPSKGLILSVLLHLAILLALGMVGLQAAPRDQLAFTATTQDSEPASAFQTFELKPVTPDVQPTEVESLVETNEAIDFTEVIGNIPSVDAAVSAATSSSFETISSTLNSQDYGSLSSEDSAASTQFCGVDGGGKHFVYLVDSSKSMGTAFESARSELLRSIAMLEPDQRFYVIFFDSDSDFMSLGENGIREASSVFATPRNKERIQSWALNIRTDTGRAPYEPLKFALQLRPDAIFLLSDGEFPKGIEDLLQTENRVENLFGDQRPVSIIHTIGYHSREGETRMRRIATANSGQYRHIPAPASSRD